MPLPKHFFYSTKTSEIQYGLTPSHHLSIPRLLEDKPHWEKTTKSIKKKPKTLIINGLLNHEWIDNQHIIFVKRLDALLKSNVNMYALLDVDSPLWKITATSTDDLDDVFCTVDMQTFQLVKQINKETGLSHDEILILSPDDIQSIINGDDDDWQQLDSFQQVDLRFSNISTDSLIRFLTEKGHEIESLDLSGCMNLSSATTLNSIKLPRLKTLILQSCEHSYSKAYCPSTIKLPSGLVAELISAAIPLESVDLSYISQHDYHDEMTHNLIEDLVLDALKEKSTLRHIKFAHVLMNEKTEQVLMQLANASLISLDLSHSKISMSTLQTLLIQAPNLQVLNISRQGNMFGELILPDELRFLSLTEIDLNRSWMNFENIKTLLMRAPNIKKFNSEHNLLLVLEELELPVENLECVQLDLQYSPVILTQRFLEKIKQIKTLFLKKGDLADLQLTHVNLGHLEHITLNCEHVSVQNLAYILNHAQKLQKIDIHKIDGLEKAMDLSPQSSVFSLISVIINFSNLHMDNLALFLRHSPDLKEIGLVNCGLVNSEFDLGDACLDALESIDFDNSDQLLWELKEILIRAPNIKRLSISKDDNEHDYENKGNDDSSRLDYDFGEVVFLRLEKLSLSTLSSLRSEYVQEILNRSPNLQNIYLGYCDNLDDEMHLSDAPFLALTSLDLRESSLTAINLEALLIRAPNLQTLHLNGCKNIHNDMHLNHAKLPGLTLLDVSQSSITTTNLEALLTRAPNVQYMALHGCMSIHKDMHLNDARFLRLKDLDISNSSITTKSLGALLKRAPRLECFRIVNAINVIDSQLLQELGSLTCLIDLSISESEINDPRLQPLLTQCKSLRKLSIHGSISPAELDRIQRLNPHLSISSFKDNDYMDEEYERQQSTGHVEADVADNHDTLLDANTSLDLDQSFSVERIFHPAQAQTAMPKVSHYRLKSFDSFTVNASVCLDSHAFRQSNDNPDLNLIHIPYRPHLIHSHHEGIETYIGQYDLVLTNNWQALPSLSPREKLTQLAPQNPHRSFDIDLAYSLRDNLYYIRSQIGSTPHSNPVPVSFTLQIEKEPYSINGLPQAVLDKIIAYQNFQAKALVMPKSNPTGYDFLNALEHQQVGACRHRTFLFKVWMNRHYPQFPVRMIHNACHSFVEIASNCFKEDWKRVDLGGYPAKLKIIEKNKTPLDKTALDQVPHLLKRTARPQKHTTSHPGKNHVKALLSQSIKPTTPQAYIQSIISNPHQHHATLIRLENKEAIAGFSHALQTYCLSIARPCFYVHSPDDLICSAACIKREADNTGRIQKGPGGRLHAFLITQAQHRTKPVLLINYDRFSPQDLVRFNALLDEKSQADGTPLPDDSHIIGLINPGKPGAYDGADFYSRFDAVETCSVENKAWNIPPLRYSEAPISSESATASELWHIELYGGHDWQERLVGVWVLNEQSLHFKPGELIRGFDRGNTHLELGNAPWDDDAFESFWRQAMITNKMDVGGHSYPVPKRLSLSARDGYEMKDAQQYLKPFDMSNTHQRPYVINPSLTGRLFGEYHCQNASVAKQKGLIETHARGELFLFISHPLTEGTWARVVDEAKRHEVILYIELAQGLSLPKQLDFLNHHVTDIISKPWPITLNNAPKIAYIHSTDIDTTLVSIQALAPLIIDISEVEAANLLTKINGRFDDESNHFVFHEETGALVNAIHQHQFVVLKGHFSLELQHLLSDMLFKHQFDPSASARVWLVGDEPGSFPVLAHYQHEVTPEDKKQALIARTHNNLLVDDSLFKQHSLSQLLTINRYLSLYPHQPGNHAWQGLETVSRRQVAPLSVPINLSNAPAVSQAFNQQRLKAVYTVLMNAPFVFLAGLSGVGKTSFVRHHWRHYTATLYQGENQTHAWAQDKTAGLKTLFIDEANISSRDWSEFEGLFNHPPGILFDNHYIELTPEHKVIFAGNPASYGAGRRMPSLFKRHGNSILFQRMPPEYLYHEVLRPLLSGLPMNTARPILDVAAYLGECSQDDVLISPRELISMALFTQAYCLQHPNAQPDQVAQHYAYTLGCHLVPDDHQNDFNERFEPPSSLIPLRDKAPAAGFIMTPSHQKAHHALNDFLTVRDLQRTHGHPLFKHHNGLGGLIIEGEPGLGKTRLVIDTLLSAGLQKGDVQADNRHNHIFYDIPVSMPFSEKTRLLLKAFHEGAVVVMDEINSASLIERLMNDLLMGRTPEGHLPEKPGFLLIGTQNPVTMAGREKISTAQKRRMQQVTILDYHREELIDILRSYDLAESIILNLVDEYLDLKQAAEHHSDLPKGCPRDLFKQAAALSKHQTTPDTNLKATGIEQAPVDSKLICQHGLFKRRREEDDNPPCDVKKARKKP